MFARNASRRPVRHLLNKRFSSTKPPFNPTPNLGSPEPSLSLSQRLRKLSREYGWSALGVYLLLTALDFPICFAAVRWLGTDRIGHWEHVIVDGIKGILPYPLSSTKTVQEAEGGAVGSIEGTQARLEEFGVVDPDSAEVGVPGTDHGVKEAEQRNKSENASKLGP